MFRKFLTKLAAVFVTLATLQVIAPAITHVVPQDLLPVVGTAEAACPLPYTFQNYTPGGPQQPIRADQINANLQALSSCIGSSPTPTVGNNTVLEATASTAFPAVIRMGFTAAGDVPPLTYLATGSPCTLNGGAGDNGSQVRSSDGKCWVTNTSDPRQFGVSQATYNFYTVTTTAGTPNVTLAGASLTSANVGNYITILGAGPYELRYIGKITAVSSPTTITVNCATCSSPFPTQSMSAFSTIVYYGADNSAQINAAMAAANQFHTGTVIPAGIYLVNEPLQCTMVNYNNANIPPPNCVGAVGNGTTLIATSDMSSSSPSSGSLMTIGGFANGSDFSQYIRNADLDGNGLTLDCNFICKDAMNIPFSQEMVVHGFQTKNALQSGFHMGNPSSPLTSAAMKLIGSSVTRDVFYVPITNIQCVGGAPVLTTGIDHGIPTGRIVAVVGGNVPQPGPINFLWTSLSSRSGALHNVDCSSWSPFSGPANLALTFPTNAIIHPIFRVSSAANGQIQINGDINIANSQTWCTYGVGGTSGAFVFQQSAPDGCYTISGVAGAGGDGPFEFNVPVNTTSFSFTGGGIAFRQMPLGDMGVYQDNITDFDAAQNFIVGVRYGFYGNPANAGYDGKYNSNHFTDFFEHGWMIAGHYLGGHNAMIGEECDVPAVFCGEFSNYGGTSTASEFQGSGFTEIPDNQTWMWRLDACSGCTTFNSTSDFTSLGDRLFGNSNTIRINEVSNHAIAGDPAYEASIPNYHSFGNSSFNTTFVIPASEEGTAKVTVAPVNPPGTTSTTLVAAGLGTTCQLTPLYKTSAHFSIFGTLSNTNAADGLFGAIYVGSGTPPVSGATFGGGTVQLGAQSGSSTFPVNGASMPFSWNGVVSNLTPGTLYWFDAAIRVIGGGTGTIANLTCVAAEE